MALQAVHDKIEDIPKQYRDLYTEKSDPTASMSLPELLV